MAEGLARKILPKTWNIYSAGTMPSHVHPLAISVMKEIGIDISKQYSKGLGDTPIDKIDHVITLCGSARDRCPVFPGKVSQEHWPIDDPISCPNNENVMDAFRRVRDDIRERIEKFASITSQ